MRDVVIFCTIDGAAGLPGTFELDGTPLIGRSDDPVGGVIRGRYEVGPKPAMFGMRARGMVDGGVTAKAALGHPILMELRRAVTVTLRIEASDEFAMHVDLERFAGHLGWIQSEAGMDIGHDEDTENLTIRVFEAGMGRFRAVLPGVIVLHEFEIPAGSGRVVERIDLRRAEWLKFKLVVPRWPAKPPADPHAVRWADRQTPQGPPSIRIAGRGVEYPAQVPSHRRFIHPGDRALRFTLAGPQLAPHPLRGTIELRAGGTARLEAVGKPTAITFDWPGELVRGFTVYRLRSDGEPTPLGVQLYYEVYRFFGMQGTHDYVIHAKGLAPVVLRNVKVDGPICELGMLEPSPGQTLRVQPAKLAEPDIVVFHAFWLDHDIWLGRGTMSRASPTAELRGLPKGTIRLQFFARGKSWTHDHASNGRGTVRLPIKLPGG